MEITFRANSRLALDYLRHLFKAEPTGPIRISLANDFGRMVVGLYKSSNIPIERAADELTVTLVLPRHRTTNAAQFHYAFLTDVDIKRLNMILDALFNIDLDAYFVQGIQAGMQKRDIIEAFIISRGLASQDYADTLSKRAYRSSLATIRRQADLIHRKARYHLSRIEPPRTEPASPDNTLIK